MRGDETPGRIVINFCTGVGVHDVITCAGLYYDRLRCVAGQILVFSIDLLRRPYNTLALPCECVISVATIVRPIHSPAKIRVGHVLEMELKPKQNRTFSEEPRINA